MAIIVKCTCGENFQTNDANAGREAKCPDCGRDLKIPGGRTSKAGGPLPYQTQALISGRAIASLILGFSSFVFLLLAGIPAILLGTSALSDINAGRGLLKGRRLAWLGIATGLFGSIVMTAVWAFPTFRHFREIAAAGQCNENLRSIGQAFYLRLEEDATFPAPAILSKDGKPLLSWRVALLPYLGEKEKALYKKFRLDEPWNGPNNIKLISEMPRAYFCPSDGMSQSGGQTHFQVMVGNGTMFPTNQTVVVNDVADGTSETILVAEAIKAVNWTEPDVVTLTGVGRSSPHPHSFHVLFVDGSVHDLPLTIPNPDLRALFTRAGSEPISGLY